MLNGVFLINTMGDVLVMKKLAVSKYQWSPEILFCQIQKCQNSILPPCIQLGKVFYIHTKSSDVYIVAVTEDELMSPFLLVESLQSFVRICNDLIGQMTAETILSQVAMVYELVSQAFGLAHPSFVTQQGIAECKQMRDVSSKKDRLFPFVPNNLFGVVPSSEDRYVKSSSAAKVPLATEKTDKAKEIFVDLIEYFAAVIDCNGKVIHTDIKGVMSTKSYLNNPVEVQLTLPDKICETPPKDRDSELIFITCKCFHTFKSNTSREHKDFPVIKYIAGPGLNPVMDYHVTSENMKLPFTLYHNFTKVVKGNLTELSLTCKLFCNLPLGCSPINWSAALPLPLKLVSVSGCSSLKSVDFSKKDKVFLMRSPIFPSQSHHSVTVIVTMSEVLPYMPYEMPCINLQFEIPNLCISNMRICGLKVQNTASSSTDSIKKWVRCVTYSNDYQFQLKSDWI